MTTKRKISVTLDAEVVDELERAGESVSAHVNRILREEFAARRRRHNLGLLLHDLDAERGPLDTPEDEREIRRFAELLHDVNYTSVNYTSTEAS